MTIGCVLDDSMPDIEKHNLLTYSHMKVSAVNIRTYGGTADVDHEKLSLMHGLHRTIALPYEESIGQLLRQRSQW